MGAPARTYCLDCAVLAPDPGDGGAIGYPSSEDTPRTRMDLNSFAFIDAGFTAIGFRNWQFEATSAFVQQHAAHRLALFIDGIAHAAGRGKRPQSPHSPTSFAFDDTDFGIGFYEATCERCGDSFRTSHSERLRPLARMPLTAVAIAEFRRRVATIHSLNFYRTHAGLVSSDAAPALGRFLDGHIDHGPVARVVTQEEWQAPPPTSMSAPLKLAWSIPGFSAQHGCPHVLADRVIALGGLRGRRASSFNLAGELIWERDLWSMAGHYVLGHSAVFDGRLWVVEGGGKTARLVAVDVATGDIVRDEPCAYGAVMWLPESRRLLGLAEQRKPTRRQSLALVSLEPTQEIIWAMDYVPESALDGLGRCAAITAEAVITMRGPELVAIDLAAGTVRWSSTVVGLAADPGSVVTGIAADGEVLITGLGPALLRNDLRSGAPLWRFSASGLDSTATRTGPHWALSGGAVYAAADTSLIALDCETGEVRMDLPSAAQSFAGTPAPRPRFRGVPFVAGASVFVMDDAGERLWAVERTSGQPQWMYRAPRGITSLRPIAAGERLFVQGPDLFCFEPV